MNKRLMDRPGWFTPAEEAPIDANLPIIDAHHHLWHVNGHRYLAEEMLSEFRNGHNVQATVYLECHSGWHKDGPENLKPVGETLFAVQQAQAAAEAQKSHRSVCNLNAGIVSFANLGLGDAVGDVIDAHIEAGEGRFRGIRHATSWDPSPKVRNSHSDPPQNLMIQTAFRQGLRQVAARGLSFDSYQYSHQISELVELAQAVPEAVIVCNHLGGLIGIGPHADRQNEIISAWKSDIVKLAKCPNVYMKIGGLVMRIRGLNWHLRERPMSSQDYLEINGELIRQVIDLFGPTRCMFESNFPMDKVSISYTNLWNSFKLIANEYSEAEKNALCSGTAANVYRLGS